MEVCYNYLFLLWEKKYFAFSSLQMDLGGSHHSVSYTICIAHLVMQDPSQIL